MTETVPLTDDADSTSPLEGVIDSLPIGDVLARVDPVELARALIAVSRHGNLRRAVPPAMGDVVNVLLGRTDARPEPRDARFADATWHDNPLFRRLAQSYVVVSDAGTRLVDQADVDWQARSRGRFAVDALAATFAPPTFPPTNPAVLKRTFETGGLSLVRGLRHFGSDMRRNHSLPSSVDRRPFVVGGNLAVTPGAVVYR